MRRDRDRGGRGGAGKCGKRRQCWVRAAAPPAGVVQASVAREEAVLGSSPSVTCRGGAGECGRGGGSAGPGSAGFEPKRHLSRLDGKLGS